MDVTDNCAAVSSYDFPVMPCIATSLSKDQRNDHSPVKFILFIWYTNSHKLLESVSCRLVDSTLMMKGFKSGMAP